MNNTENKRNEVIKYIASAFKLVQESNLDFDSISSTDEDSWDAVSDIRDDLQMAIDYLDDITVTDSV